MTSAAYMEAIFALFTPAHIAVICGALAIFAGAVPFFWKKKHLENKVLFFGALFTISISLMLFVFSVLTGVYDLEWYLPFHICNSFMLVYPLALIFKGKVRKFLKDFIVFGGFFGCWLEIVFPINTLPYLSAAHFATVMVWIYHVVIGLVSVYYVASGHYREFRANSIVTIISLLITISYFMNSAFNVNFLFINADMKIFPLTIFYDYFGDNGIIVFAALLLIFSTTIHAVSITVSAYKKRYEKSLLNIPVTARLAPVRI